MSSLNCTLKIVHFHFTQIKYTCNNDLVSQECTDFGTSTMDIDSLAEGESPDIAVIRLMKADETSGTGNTDATLGGTKEAFEEGLDDSPAASHKGALATAGIILAVASLGGLV